MPIAALGNPFGGQPQPPFGTSDPNLESASYSTQRRNFVNTPRAFVRFYHVPTAGGGTEYPFSTDFSTDTILAATVPKLSCITALVLPPTQVIRIAGRSEIQTATVKLDDLEREILHYVSDPAQPLAIGLTTQCSSRGRGFVSACAESGVANAIEIADARGYPSRGHVTIDSEDYSYTGRDLGQCVS